MNTAVRALPQGREQFRRHVQILNFKPSMGTLLLAIIVMLSGLAVVYTADLNRRLFMELQTIQNNQGQIRQEYGNLLLEQSTWSTEARMESLAQQRLNMSIPPTSKIVIIKQSHVIPSEVREMR